MIDILDAIAAEAARIIRGKDAQIRDLQKQIQEKDAELLFYRIASPILFLLCIAAAVTLILV